MRDFLQNNACGDLLGNEAQQQFAMKFELSAAAAEGEILTLGFLPARYQRNRKMLSLPQQLKLHQSCVAVAGCGGLGGYVIEELARLGVGKIIALDPDIFEAHNLNRQLLATSDQLGKPKAEAAAQRVAMVNPAVALVAIQAALETNNGPQLLKTAHLVVDAVDSVAARLEIGRLCQEQNLPLVHGAIAGWYGQVTTVLPGDRTLETLYRHWQGGKGIEAELGNPAFTPALVASLQVAEAVKILLATGDLLQNRVLTLDLLRMSVETIDLIN